MYIGGTSNAISLGGYKRPASSCSSSSTFSSLTSSGTNVKIPRISNSSESSLKGRGRLPKRKRGRPRKVVEEPSNISDDSYGSSGPVPFKRKRGRPRKHETNTCPNEQHPPLEINKDAVTSLTHQNHLPLTTTNSLTENDNSNNLLHEPMMANELNNSYCPRKHIVQPATIIPSAIQELTHPIMSLNTVTSNSQTSSTFEISSNTSSCTGNEDISIEPISNNQSYSNSHMTTNPHQVVYATILSHSMTDTVTTQTNCSLSSAHKQHVHDLARNLRPRSLILPPPQFRQDSIYDVETTPAPPSKNIPNGGEVFKPETSTCDYLPTQSTVTTPISTVNIATSVPLTQVQTDIIHPSIYTSTEATPTSEAPQEVKDLLQTHLSHLQCPPPSTEIWTNKMQNDVDSHTLDENTFLDILFCFMKMRKTPIHRIPRLGSKCCEYKEWMDGMCG